MQVKVRPLGPVQQAMDGGGEETGTARRAPRPDVPVPLRLADRPGGGRAGRVGRGPGSREGIRPHHHYSSSVTPPPLARPPVGNPLVSAAAAPTAATRRRAAAKASPCETDRHQRARARAHTPPALLMGGTRSLRRHAGRQLTRAAVLYAVCGTRVDEGKARGGAGRRGELPRRGSCARRSTAEHHHAPSAVGSRHTPRRCRRGVRSRLIWAAAPPPPFPPLPPAREARRPPEAAAEVHTQGGVRGPTCVDGGGGPPLATGWPLSGGARAGEGGGTPRVMGGREGGAARPARRGRPGAGRAPRSAVRRRGSRARPQLFRLIVEPPPLDPLRFALSTQRSAAPAARRGGPPVPAARVEAWRRARRERRLRPPRAGRASASAGARAENISRGAAHPSGRIFWGPSPQSPPRRAPRQQPQRYRPQRPLRQGRRRQRRPAVGATSPWQPWSPPPRAAAAPRRGGPPT